jgi:multiple sugar transport system permease protein
VPSAAIAGVFSKLSIENERIPLLAIYVWKNSGFLMLIFLAAFSMVSKDIYEAAAIDGAKKIRIFFNVTLPMTAGAILFAVILAVSYNLRLFREAYLLYGAYPDTNIYLTQHYMNNHFYQLNYQKLTTAASMFFTVLVIFVWFGLSVADRFIEERDNDI